ncbi:MAG TPA: hypothetical protein VGM54_15375 [Chthoniobacter sp.]
MKVLPVEQGIQRFQPTRSLHDLFGTRAKIVLAFRDRSPNDASHECTRQIVAFPSQKTPRQTPAFSSDIAAKPAIRSAPNITQSTLKESQQRPRSSRVTPRIFSKKSSFITLPLKGPVTRMLLFKA